MGKRFWAAVVATVLLLGAENPSYGDASVSHLRNDRVTTPGAAVRTAPGNSLSPRQRALHLLNRFTFGPRPGSVEAVLREGLEPWFVEQLHPESIDDHGTEGRLEELTTLRQSPAALAMIYVEGERAMDLKAQGMEPPHTGDILTELGDQKVVRACESNRQLQEVMADFWENHFNIDWHKTRYRLTDYDLHVIRPRALGHFPDLLKAVAHSPAMLDYLDNKLSTRNPSPRDRQRRRLAGINENYARELMELHTLGVRGGYTQHDVVEVARCLTGWTIEAPKGEQLGRVRFIFRRELHDNGPKTVLGHFIPPNGGQRDGEEVLDILAHHPSTAHFIAFKLCRHFVSDNPPESLVRRVAGTYTRTDGDIRSMLVEIYRSPEFWAPAAYRAKIKTPYEMVISAMRTIDAHLMDGGPLLGQLQRMGEGLYQCEPPTGYKDTADAWVSSGGLLLRLNFALALAEGRQRGVEVDLAPFLDPLRTLDPQGEGNVQAVDILAQQLLHDDISRGTRQSLEDAVRGRRVDYSKLIGLILGSPEFQRR